MSAETFLKGAVTLYCGDCLDVLKTLPDNSIDSCVTDPPYHLVSIVKRFSADNAAPPKEYQKYAHKGRNPYKRVSTGFMNKQWDGGDIAQSVDMWREVCRVLKPGAHLLAFGGTRTYHRMACAIEDAEFEIRDCIQWLYGSGFPKSHDVSKGIDRAAGAVREIIGIAGKCGPASIAVARDNGGEYNATSAATDAARQWEGWGTALKPANEPIVLARKPLSEATVAANVLKWGTGAINVDGCRVGTEVETWPKSRSYAPGQIQPGGIGETQLTGPMPNGRWPANVIHDGSEEVVAGLPSSSYRPPDAGGTGNLYTIPHREGMSRGHDDDGSNARFFYTAKADSDDRLGSKHPTVKPLDLMQYLVRLITPKGGTVLDMFVGTGTTGEAAWREGMKAILIEREAEYQDDIRRRMKLAFSGPDERARESIKEKLKGKPIDAGPLFE